MEPKIKYFITADYASIDETSKKLSVSGFFDTFRITLFPAESPQFYIVLGCYNVRKTAEIYIECIAPDGEKTFDADTELHSASIHDTVNIVTQISIPLPLKGTYIINIYNKNTMELMESYPLHTDFPPARVFADGEIEHILNDPNLAKGAKIKIECPICNQTYHFEHNLDPNQKVSEGYLIFPENNILECCDSPVDLTGVRRHIEWNFGTKLKK